MITFIFQPCGSRFGLFLLWPFPGRLHPLGAEEHQARRHGLVCRGRGSTRSVGRLVRTVEEGARSKNKLGVNMTLPRDKYNHS